MRGNALYFHHISNLQGIQSPQDGIQWIVIHGNWGCFSACREGSPQAPCWHHYTQLPHRTKPGDKRKKGKCTHKGSVIGYTAEGWRHLIGLYGDNLFKRRKNIWFHIKYFFITFLGDEWPINLIYACMALPSLPYYLKSKKMKAIQAAGL